ncbi:MAG: cysteine desulfurase [Clostridiales bacterium]|nr:cysteine desulfurase [Clostridiales bacterium]
MEAYFDNSATTRCSAGVRDIVVKAMTEDFGNPSAMHRKGVEAEQYIRRTSEILAGTLKVSPKEILYTSGGTESDNLAVFGAAQAGRRKGLHVITSAVEHPAVAQPMEALRGQGYEVTVLPVDSRGVVRMDALEEALRPDTILVSIMYVNNETGSVMPVEQIGQQIHARSPQALFHVDAIQAFGKYRIYPRRTGIDLLSVSSHKIHGPKGCGFLYVRDGVRIRPQILGGGQQNGMRSGTDNVPGIAGLGEAAREAYEDFEEKTARLYALKERMAAGLETIPDVRVNGMPLPEAAPHILSITFPGVRSEVLLHALEERGIYVSARSACASHKSRPSTTLTAMGLSAKEAQSAIRVSFSEENTPEEVDYTLKALRELVPMLRRYSRH